MTQTIRERRGQIAVTVASRHIWSLALARLLVAYCWLYSYPICLTNNYTCAFVFGQFFVHPSSLLANLHLKLRRHWWQNALMSFLMFTICIFSFVFFWRECLGFQVLIVLTVLSFRFSGLCFKQNATIHFHGQASPVGVWSFLRLPLNPSRG